MTSPTLLRVAKLPQNRPTPFLLEPDGAARAALAGELEILEVRKLRFEGEVRAHGSRDFMLEGTLGATVVQACVVTLEPVTTRIDAEIRRHYVEGLPEPEPGETEMPEDEEVEPLGQVIDLEAVMAEALALELPDYPRKDGAEPGDVAVAEPGAVPLTDDDVKPFAGLRDVLKGKPDEE